jgi:hypothetical protein
MTVPVFTEGEFIAFLKDNGWNIVSTDYWEEHNRIIFEKDGRTVTFQCKGGGKYFYPEVVQTCKAFEVNPPTDHIHSYYRHLSKDNDPCYCENGKTNGVKFKDCHGKPSTV